MASSLRTKLRIAGTVLGCRGFFDAWLGRVLWQPLPNPSPKGEGPPEALLPPPLKREGVTEERGGGRGISLRGALHVHTCTYSDGAGTMEEVMGAAQRAGVDFVLLTDHNTMCPKADGWEEKYVGQKPFLIVGDEITVEGGAFLLALDLPGTFDFPVRQPSQAAIDAVIAAGGLPLVSLPFDMKHPWEDWDAKGCEGLEVLNLSTVAREQINALSLLFWLLPLWKLKGELAVIQALCARPDAALARWDRLLTSGRKSIGLGALDAHALMKILGKKYPIPSYENSFKAVSTWVLAADRTPTAVHTAVRAGRCYFSYDCLGDAAGMVFTATDSGVMGDDAPLGSTLYARAPDVKALVRLYLNGRVMAAGRGEVSFTPTGPGAYRVEVYRVGASLGALHLNTRPWIFTNPIYVR